MTAGAEPGRWLRTERTQLARDRILDAARDVFAEQGVRQTSVDEVAARARCSRGTVYRYFGTRDGLRLAFILREAQRLHMRLADHVSGLANPGEVIVQGMAFALAEVRKDPTLAVWFEPDAQGTTLLLAGRSQALFAMAVRFVDHLLQPAATVGVLRRDVSREQTAEWLMRAMFSLLTVQGPAARSPEEEQAYLRAFVLPSVLR